MREAKGKGPKSIKIRKKAEVPKKAKSAKEKKINAPAKDRTFRTAVLGVGNALRGDDGIGPKVIEMLSKDFSGKDSVLLVDCGEAPESFLGKIESFSPDRIVVVDAVKMCQEPGTVREVDHKTIVGDIISTHKLPLIVFLKLFEDKAEITFIGVEPEKTGFGEEMSGKVSAAAETVAERIRKML